MDNPVSNFIDGRSQAERDQRFNAMGLAKIH
jgi:hypothetical protein